MGPRPILQSAHSTARKGKLAFFSGFYQCILCGFKTHKVLHFIVLDSFHQIISLVTFLPRDALQCKARYCDRMSPVCLSVCDVGGL